MGKLIFGNTKLISSHEELHKDLLMLRFMEAYLELRAGVPGGTLRIHLYVEADSSEEVGVKYEEENPRERGDDDGVEYADPRDEMEERLLR